MLIIKNFHEYSADKTPIVLSIGNFDGVHLGHQKVIQRAVNLAEEINGKTVVLSFENHPSSVLRPENPTEAIISPSHKAYLLEQMGVDTLLFLQFTKEFSNQETEQFLRHMRNDIPFSELVLGHDATIGKDKRGNKNVLVELGKVMNFSAEYVAPLKLEGAAISSSAIRTAIKEGDFIKVSSLLGRTYSIRGPVKQGQNNGNKIGFPTANIDISHLCQPPLGVYSVTVSYNNNHYQGVANLGIAPTLHAKPFPVLEVHLLGFDNFLYGKEIEVFFHQFLRKEKKFSSVNALKEQIQNDIIMAKNSSLLKN